MRVTMIGAAYVAESSYAEKDIAKKAGFTWNRVVEKRWATTDWQKAAKLAEYCDDAAQAAIVAAQRLEAEDLDASRAVDADIDVPAPDGLAYMPFQKAGIAYASARANTLIADEMGLGKTIQALGVINGDPSIRTVLVICPASLRLNWQREARKWLVRQSHIYLATTKGIPANAVDLTAAMPESHVVMLILNYDILRRWRRTLRSITWDLLISDESHYLKNPKAQRTQEVFGHWDRDPELRLEAIPATRRLYLTGTPIVNRPIELWPLLHSVGWKSWKFFVERYCAGYEDNYGWQVGGASNLDELQAKLRSSIMVRRLKRDVLTDLPPKRRQVIEIPGNGASEIVAAEQVAWAGHRARLEALQGAVEDALAEDDENAYARAVLALAQGEQVAFTEMSQVRHDTALAKVPYVIEHLVEAVDSSQRVICFGYHHDVIAAIRRGLHEAGISSIRMTGEDKMEERQAAKDTFEEEYGPAVIVGSIPVMGVGWTLTRASHVVFAELDWVPGNMSQAEDRCHRIGQRESVLVQHLVLEGSMDADMANRLVEKQAVIDQALDKPTDTAAIAEKVWGSMLSLAPTANRNTTREQVAAEAETITPQEIEEVHAKLQWLSARCDGALALDGAGFNRFDARMGHSLAHAPRLTPKQAILGRHLVHKYRGQLSGIFA